MVTDFTIFLDHNSLGTGLYFMTDQFLINYKG